MKHNNLYQWRSYFELLRLKNGRRRAEADDPMGGEGRAEPGTEAEIPMV